MTNPPTSPGEGEGRFETEADPDSGILTVRFSGALTATLARKALDHYSTEASGYGARLRLWDLRRVEIRISAAEIQSVARLSRERDRDPSGRLALLVSDDLAYGLGRLHQAFRESERTAQRIFRDEFEARRWLLSAER